MADIHYEVTISFLTPITPGTRRTSASAQAF